MLLATSLCRVTPRQQDHDGEQQNAKHQRLPFAGFSFVRWMSIRLLLFLERVSMILYVKFLQISHLFQELKSLGLRPRCAAFHTASKSAWPRPYFVPTAEGDPRMGLFPCQGFSHTNRCPEPTGPDPRAFLRSRALADVLPATVHRFSARIIRRFQVSIPSLHHDILKV